MAIALRNFCEQITSSISNLIVYFISYYFITFYNYFKEKFSFLHKQLLTLSDNIIQKKKIWSANSCCSFFNQLQFHTYQLWLDNWNQLPFYMSRQIETMTDTWVKLTENRFRRVYLFKPEIRVCFRNDFCIVKCLYRKMRFFYKL